MTLAYLACALFAALGFYLGCRHQRLWALGEGHARLAHWAGWGFSLLSLVAAIRLLGVWAGVFSALTALMLVLVLLPYLDGWRQLRKGSAHVG